MTRVNRVLVIGLDGATLDLIEPWATAGHLPVMAELMATGSYSRLRSVYPVLSSAAWSSFMTGLNPGKHGIYDFVARQEGSYSLQPVLREQMAGRSLWRILSERGMRVGVINVPMTYPPESVNGILVSGLGTPDHRDFTYPTALSRRLRQDGYRVNRRVFHKKPGDEQAFLEDTYDLSARLTRATLQLMKEEPWDFFMVVYRDSDEVPHAFWSYMDETHPAHDAARAEPFRNVILDCYQRLDKSVGDLIAAAGPDTTVVVISDHGAGPLYKDVFLNEWLRREGLLVTGKPKSFRRILARLRLTRTNASRALRVLQLARVERWIKDVLQERIEALPRDAWGDFSEVIDWSVTQAYSFGYHGQVYINLSGREPEGIVAPGDEFKRIRAEIIHSLRRWRDPDDGKPVVSSVYTSDELFDGPRVHDAPDIIVVMRDLAYITRQGHEFGYQPGTVFSPPVTYESGGHRLDGVLIASGPGMARRDEELPAASLMDIAPTILHLLGSPVPEHMDGHVLLDRLSSEWQNLPIETYRDDDWATSEQHGAALSDIEEKELLERLRGLGYS